MDALQYSIRDLSREFDVTTRTLRFYEEKGLLNPTRNGQNRIFSASDRTRLLLILRGKRLGLTLEESAELILMYDPASTNEDQLKALIAKIGEKKARLEQQKQDLEEMIQDLQDWETRSKKSLRQLSKQNAHRKQT